MLFIEWRLVVQVLVLAAVFLVCLLPFWVEWKRRKQVREWTLILVSPLAILSGLLLLLQFGAFGCQAYSKPIYSPDGQKAIRIRTSDEGATGGQTSVELFSDHGWHLRTVYFGGWKSVQDGDVNWLDNKHLVVRFDPEYGYHDCHNAKDAIVSCEPKGAPHSSTSQ